MNICFLLGGFTGNGGIGRVTSILANTLCEDEKYKIYTLSYFRNNKENLYHLNKKIYQDCLFDEPINMTKGILRGGISKLRQYLKSNQIDILIACGALYYPISILSRNGLKTKCICWEHSNVQNSKDHSFQLLCRRFGAKYADVIVTLTQHDKRSYIKQYNVDNVVQIYNPIDEEVFNYTRDYNLNSKKLLSVGRLSYQKNFEALIDIARDLLIDDPMWTWDIYGEGELRDELQSKINKYGLEKQVQLKGQVHDLYRLYGDYSMLVMTSRYEGFPMSLLEGLANGLPLISFDVLTGPNEIIINGENGYLIEAFDLKMMASVIDKLINDSNKRYVLSQKGKEMCNKYKLSEIIVDWKHLFENLTDEERNT